MALSLTDPSTWQASTLETPEGDITYWVIPDWDNYYEQYEDDNNLTRIHIAVAWKDASLFKWYAVGFAEYNPSYTFFVRHAPLRNPLLAWEDQYLKSLRKVKVHAGVHPTGGASYHYQDPLIDNWPNFDPTVAGMPARIIYEAVFATLPYEVIPQNDFRDGAEKEQKRHVVRTRSVNPRERRVPAQAFEVAGTVVPEVGFIPYYDYELRMTWMRVPRDRVPDTAIESLLLKANNAAFDWNYKTDSYGRYREGDLVFTGLAQPIVPYRGPNGEWLADVPYVFRFQPADGTGDGMLKVPRYTVAGGSTWVKPIVRGSSGSPKYLYEKGDFEALFKPEP